jgi:hypothetical protein
MTVAGESVDRMSDLGEALSGPPVRFARERRFLRCRRTSRSRAFFAM